MHRSPTAADKNPSQPARRPSLADRLRAGRRIFGFLATAFALFLSGYPEPAQAAPVSLSIRVVYAHSDSRTVDPRLESLVRDLSALKYTAYELKDEASFSLEPGAIGRMQLPNGAWLTVVPSNIADDGMLRLTLEVKKLKFKTTAAIGEGATLALGGPPLERGVMILAITRAKPAGR